MKFRSRRPATPEPEAQALPKPDDARRNGPWDRSERAVEATAAYFDFGSFLVRPIAGMKVQVAAQESTNVAVLLNLNGSALELRAFAASQLGDDWEEMVPGIVNEIEGRGAQAEVRQGLFGTEVSTDFPAKDADGKATTQPACFIGVRGPRWLLRATLLGNAAKNPDSDNELIAVVRDVVVARGPEARMRGELLPIEIPIQMQSSEPAQGEDTTQGSAPQQGREA